MSDLKALVKAARSGDRLAFQQLVDATRANLFHLILSILRDHQDAEDTLQEVYIKVYKNLPRFREEARVTTWMHRIAVNTCMDRKRGARVIELSVGDEPDQADEVRETKPETHPDRALAARDIREQIAAAKNDLTPFERTIFTLRHEQELKLREIADTLSCTEGTVKNILFRAIRKLRDRLAHFHGHVEGRTP
jgi:RNA polymerase sigma-70 factor (ECF subfamily)